MSEEEDDRRRRIGEEEEAEAEEGSEFRVCISSLWANCRVKRGKKIGCYLSTESGEEREGERGDAARPDPRLTCFHGMAAERRRGREGGREGSNNAKVICAAAATAAAAAELSADLEIKTLDHR